MPGRLVQPIKDHQVTENTISFASVVEDPKKPLHLLKVFPDELGHRIVNSISREFQFDSGGVASEFELFTWQAWASAIRVAGARKWIQKLMSRQPEMFGLEYGDVWPNPESISFVKPGKVTVCPPALQSLWERYATPGSAMPGVKKVVKSRFKVVFGQDRGRNQIVFKTQFAYTSFDVVGKTLRIDWSVF